MLFSLFSSFSDICYESKNAVTKTSNSTLLIIFIGKKWKSISCPVRHIVRRNFFSFFFLNPTCTSCLLSGLSYTYRSMLLPIRQFSICIFHRISTYQWKKMNVYWILLLLLLSTFSLHVSLIVFFDFHQSKCSLVIWIWNVCILLLWPLSPQIE